MTTYRDRLEAGEHTDKDQAKLIAADARKLEKQEADRAKELEARQKQLDKRK